MAAPLNFNTKCFLFVFAYSVRHALHCSSSLQNTYHIIGGMRFEAAPPNVKTKDSIEQ